MVWGAALECSAEVWHEAAGEGGCRMAAGHGTGSAIWVQLCGMGTGPGVQCRALWHGAFPWGIAQGAWGMRHMDVWEGGRIAWGAAKVQGVPTDCNHVACSMALGCGRGCVGAVACRRDVACS